MDLAATSQDVPVGPRIYMQLSRYCQKEPRTYAQIPVCCCSSAPLQQLGRPDVIVDTHIRLESNAQPLLGRFYTTTQEL
jgi:hypothetical protein